jgi:hypothetical protein
MIAYYFDEDARQLVQGVQSRVQLLPQTWVYGDNYNLQIYITRSGIIQTLASGDTLSILVFQPPSTLPANNLIIVSSPTVLTDASGDQYYQVNVNLKTTQLAALVQAANQPAPVELHFVFSPADGERFSLSADIQVTVNPDPLQGASGATPAPPGYPASPSVFEQVANKGVAGGYVGLDGNAHLDPNKIPIDTTLHVTGGVLGAVGGGGGNAWVGSIPATFSVTGSGQTISVTMGATVGDMVAGQGILVTDGVHYINGFIATVSGTALSFTVTSTVGAPYTMAANSHVYLGNAASLATTVEAGLIPVIPGVVTQFLNGNNAFSVPQFPSLGALPATFTPSPHGPQHLPTGNDPTPLGTPTVAGLMPPIDNSTITIVGGKLQANVTGAGGNSWVSTITGSPAIPALGGSATFTLATAWSGFRAGQSCVITDGSQVMNGIITTYTPGTPASITVRNLGTPGTSVSGNFGPTAYVFMGGSPDIATVAAPGISRPDNVTLGISGGLLASNVNPYVAIVSGQQAIPAAGATAAYALTNVLPNDFHAGQSILITDGTYVVNGIVTAWSNPNLTFRNLGNPGSAVSGSFIGSTHVYLGNCSDLATATQPGIVRADGTTITSATGVLSVPTATNTVLGIVRPDTTTITQSGGVLSAAAGGIGQHGARVWRSASVAIVSGTAIAFDTPILNTDSGGYWSAGTNPSRITIPAGQGGIYAVGGNVVWTGSITGGTYRQLVIRVGGNANDNIADQGRPVVSGDTSNNGAGMSLSSVYQLNAGQFIELVPVTDQTGQTAISYGTNVHASPVLYAIRIS